MSKKERLYTVKITLVFPDYWRLIGIIKPLFNAIDHCILHSYYIGDIEKY